MTLEVSDLNQHIIILGWDQFAHGLVEQLLAADNQLAVVTSDTEARTTIYEEFGRESVYVAVSSLMDFHRLDGVGIERCRKVFVNLESDHDSLIAVLSLQAEFGENLNIDVVVQNENLQDTFYVAGANYAVSPGALASNIVASQIYEEDAGEVYAELLYATETLEDCELQQYRITEANEYCGETYGSLFWGLKEKYNAVVLGLSKVSDEGRHNLHKMPEGDLEVEAGDYAVVMVRGDREEDLVEMFGVDEGIARV